MKRVIFPTDDGGVVVLIPANGWAVADVARKDVPAGIPYRIVDESDIPEDRSDRDLWTADFSSPDGYGEGQ